jgi:hypothetical protein
VLAHLLLLIGAAGLVGLVDVGELVFSVPSAEAATMTMTRSPTAIAPKTAPSRVPSRRLRKVCIWSL